MAKVTGRNRDFLKRQAKAAGVSLSAGGGVMTKLEKREFLRRIVLDEKARMTDRLYALEIDNKMSGDNEPEKVALGLGADFLALVRRKAGE